MGDISTEPSMEEILSSIKRIIAEEGDMAVASRSRRAPKVVPAPETEGDEVLELSEAVTEEPTRPVAVVPAPAPMPIGAADPAPQPAQPEPILSPGAVEASRGKLEALSRMIVKPEPAAAADNTLEGLVRELLKPMLREWLDANLPQIVDQMVAREIARITSRQ